MTPTSHKLLLLQLLMRPSYGAAKSYNSWCRCEWATKLIAISKTAPLMLVINGTSFLESVGKILRSFVKLTLHSTSQGCPWRLRQ
ncbi:hypothetical protein QL285_061438 [Trifolium repens]|nr:hypothetical protein QL285_061438 [Trifolium repens]